MPTQPMSVRPLVTQSRSCILVSRVSIKPTAGICHHSRRRDRQLLPSLYAYNSISTLKHKSSLVFPISATPEFVSRDPLENHLVQFSFSLLSKFNSKYTSLSTNYLLCGIHNVGGVLCKPACLTYIPVYPPIQLDCDESGHDLDSL